MRLEDFEGKWAIVTGASSGIGAEFARQLAEKGLNTVLVARREDKLKALAKEIQDEYGTKSKALVQDMEKKDAVDNIAKATSKLDVAVFVSNAGFAKMGPMDSVALSDYESMVDLNVLSHLRVAKHYSEYLSKKGSGGIIFTSSMVALQGVAMASNYSAAKAYILNLGESLNAELKEKGVNVSVLAPGATDTEMIGAVDGVDFSGIPMKFMPPSQAVKESLRGLEKNKPLVIPGFLNKFQTAMTNKLMKRSVGTKIWSAVMRRVAH